MVMEPHASMEESLTGREDKQPSVSVPRGWNRILEKGSILYISPNKSRIRCEDDLAQYLLLEGACKCGLECPFRIEDVFNFDPDIPSRLQENETVTSPHCIVSKKFSRFFPSDCQQDGLHLMLDSESSRKKKRRGQNKPASMPLSLTEDTNGIIQSGMRLPMSPSKRPRKNPSRLPPSVNNAPLMMYGRTNGGSRYMLPSEMLEDSSKVFEDASVDGNSPVSSKRDYDPYLPGKSCPMTVTSSDRTYGTDKTSIAYKNTTNETSHLEKLVHPLKDSPNVPQGSSHNPLPALKPVMAKALRSPTHSFNGPEILANGGRDGITFGNRHLSDVPISVLSENPNLSSTERTTNVVSLGLASCVAMSVSASTDSEVDRHPRSDSLPGKGSLIQPSRNADIRNSPSASTPTDISKNSIVQNTAKVRAKNTTRKKPVAKSPGEAKSKQSRVDKTRTENVKKQRKQGADISNASGLVWNSLPGGTVPAQIPGVYGTSPQGQVGMDLLTLCSVSQATGATDSSRGVQGNLNNTLLSPKSHKSGSVERTPVQVAQPVLSDERKNWGNTGVYSHLPQNVNSTMPGLSSPDIQGCQRNDRLDVNSHLRETQIISQISKSTGKGNADRVARSPIDAKSHDNYNINRKEMGKGRTTSETPGPEAPPNITLSPSLSSTLLQKESDNRPLLSLSNMAVSMSSNLDVPGATRLAHNDGPRDPARVAMSGAVKGNEKESESKQQAKANVYWCSQNSTLEQPPISPSVNSSTSSQLSGISNEPDNNQVPESQDLPSSTTAWSKGQSVNRHMMSPPSASMTSPPTGARGVNIDHTTTPVESQATGPQQSRNKSNPLPPNVPLLSMPSCSGTSTPSTSRELLNTPLPMNTQSQAVTGQQSTYMFQGQEAAVASSVGQPMVLLRFVSQASSNAAKSSATFSSPSSTSTQAHVLPSSYGIPVTQPVYHSQLANYAMQGVPGNSGHVFIMGNTHASQALQNLALQSNQVTKDDGTGSLVYQTGYSTHALRSPTASLSYAGIPLQLMTIAGSTMVARPPSQSASKADSYAAMFQYYQKQMELSRIGSGQVQLAPAPGLIRPLATQVSPTFGNSYIRIAPAFGTMSGKDGHTQAKSGRNASDNMQSSSMMWPASDKVKLPTTSCTSHYSDSSASLPYPNTNKEARNSNSPLSPKFELSRLKHTSYHNSQTVTNTKTNTSISTSPRDPVSSICNPSLAENADSKPFQGQVITDVGLHNASSQRKIDSTSLKSKPTGHHIPVSSNSEECMSASGVRHDPLSMPANVTTNHLVRKQAEYGSHESKLQLDASKIQARHVKNQQSYDHQSTRNLNNYSGTPPSEAIHNSNKMGGSNAGMTTSVPVSKSFSDVRLKEGSIHDSILYSKMDLSRDSNYAMFHSVKRGSEGAKPLGLQNQPSTFKDEYDMSRRRADMTEIRTNARRCNIGSSLENELPGAQYYKVDKDPSGNHERQFKQELLTDTISRKRSPPELIGKVIVSDEKSFSMEGMEGGDMKSGESESGAVHVIGSGENQIIPKNHDSEEMSLQCLEDCSHISGDSCAPSPKCPSKNSPIYFSEAKGKVLQVGDLVWGEFNGYPSWPGKIVSENDINKGPPEPGKVWVQWFGDHSFEQANLSDLKTLNEGLRNLSGPGKKQKNSDGKSETETFQKAVCEALREAEVVTTMENHMPVTQSKQPRGRGRKRKAK